MSSSSPEYHAWYNAKRRCLDEDVPHYSARGITICKRWQGKMGFFNFVSDMGRRPSLNHSLDRRNNDRGYSKSNCRWATKEEQNNNRCDSRRVKFKGKTMTISQWEKCLGFYQQTIRRRLDRGWPVDRAFNKNRGGL
jgi:hypothetical protein